MSRPLLVVGHAADHTGPPIYLRNLLRWLREHGPAAGVAVDVDVALLAGGDLLDDLRALAPVTVFEPLTEELPDDVRQQILSGEIDGPAWWAARRHAALREMMAPFAGAQVLYVNGAPGIELARALPPGERVHLCHSHELEIGLVHRLGPADRTLFTTGATRVYSVADAVTRYLVEQHAVDPDVIEHHAEMVDVVAIHEATSGLQHAEHRRAARRSKGLDPDCFVVGACGTVEFRKGTDLFLQMAWHVHRADTSRPVTFVWVGGDEAGIACASARAADLGLQGTVQFVGPQTDPATWFALMDVFVMPSREDPFPLVCIEAAASGIPIVAFDTGGIAELLRQGCGEVMAYPDVAGLAHQVIELLRNEQRRTTMGARGRELTLAQHDVSVVAPGVWSSIRRWL
ncbi:MAG: glycosyltransferase family 4 protein [Acidimicrobiia bacterium]|nr:glycosyltransferase family 4 protein [Acidimicrobiia bacterium]